MGLLSKLRKPKELPTQPPRWRILVNVEQADEVPDALPERTAAFVGTTKRPKWLVFDCPCPKGHRIMLNLDLARWPRWYVTRKSPLTVSPSIDDVGDGRRCHFFLRNGALSWVKETRRRAWR